MQIQPHNQTPNCLDLCIQRAKLSCAWEQSIQVPRPSARDSHFSLFVAHFCLSTTTNYVSPFWKQPRTHNRRSSEPFSTTRCGLLSSQDHHISQGTYWPISFKQQKAWGHCSEAETCSICSALPVSWSSHAFWRFDLASRQPFSPCSPKAVQRGHFPPVLSVLLKKVGVFNTGSPALKEKKGEGL